MAVTWPAVRACGLLAAESGELDTVVTWSAVRACGLLVASEASST
jgi:hypothetical protein